MPVGFRLGGDAGADGLARACAVLHHHRMPEALLQVLGDQAREDVGRAGGRRGQDHPHGFRRKVLGGRGGGEPGEQGGGQQFLR
ncbi:hypothetical protein D3C83_57940 [compost metagenome]